MIDPFFAPDGETIVFTWEVGDHKDFWSIEPKGVNLHQLPQAPQWYASAKDSPVFTNLEQENGSAPNPDAPSDEQKTVSFRSPDGLVELVLRQTDSADDQVDGPGHGKHYELRDLKTGKATEFQQLPGFEGVFEILHDSLNKDQHFLIEPPLRLAFFGLHLNSTDGDTCYALDLVNRRLVRLSPNRAAPIPLPGEPAFLTWTSERYVGGFCISPQKGEHKNPGASSPTELRKPFGSLIHGDTIGLRCRAPRRCAFTSSRWFCVALAQ